MKHYNAKAARLGPDDYRQQDRGKPNEFYGSGSGVAPQDGSGNDDTWTVDGHISQKYPRMENYKNIYKTLWPYTEAIEGEWHEVGNDRNDRNDRKQLPSGKR